MRYRTGMVEKGKRAAYASRQMEADKLGVAIDTPRARERREERRAELAANPTANLLPQPEPLPRDALRMSVAALRAAVKQRENWLAKGLATPAQSSRVSNELAWLRQILGVVSPPKKQG